MEFEMRSKLFLYLIYFLAIARPFCVAGIDGKPAGQKINISLAAFNTSLTNGQAFYTRVPLIPTDVSMIEITHTPPEVSFLIVQIHTHEFNVTLSYNTTQISGCNVGLELHSNAIRFSELSVTNPYNESIWALVAVVAYTSKAPMPGGCNGEFPVEISPFSKSILTNATVEIDTQPASALINGRKLSCGSNDIKYELYHLYTQKWDFTDVVYFDAIAQMLTVENITKNGVKVSSGTSGSMMRKIFSAYAGAGSVYVMVATFNNYSAAYVPLFSYSCTRMSNGQSCQLLDNTLAKILCAFILFVGFFFTFIGHDCFRAELFILGCFTGGMIGYTALHYQKLDDSTLHLGLAIAIGLVFGIVWQCLYCRFNRPCIAILQATMLLGALVASTTYYGMSDDVVLFKDNATFWTIYASMVLMVPMLLSVCFKDANIICSAFIGAYAIILPIDFWLGSNLKYIIINTIRRITVAGFNVAIIHPPFQSKDIWLSAIWVLLALFGIHVQRRKLEGRSPFPNGRYHTTIISDSEPLFSRLNNHRQVVVLKNPETVYHSTNVY